MGRLNRLPKRPTLDRNNSLPHDVADKILFILERETAKNEDPWGREAEFWYYLLGTAMWSGLRLSELLGLTIDELITSPEGIRVQQQWGWKARAKTRAERFAPLKSEYANRTVPFPAASFGKLHNWSARLMKAGAPDNLVFPRPTAEGWGYWGSSSYFHRSYNEMSQKVYDLYKEEADKRPSEVPYTQAVMTQVFHKYRHLYASICLSEEKYDVNTVSKWLGHFSPAFTYEVYSGIIDEVASDAARRMRKIGSGGKQQGLF